MTHLALCMRTGLADGVLLTNSEAAGAEIAAAIKAGSADSSFNKLANASTKDWGTPPAATIFSSTSESCTKFFVFERPEEACGPRFQKRSYQILIRARIGNHNYHRAVKIIMESHAREKFKVCMSNLHLLVLYLSPWISMLKKVKKWWRRCSIQGRCSKESVTSVLKMRSQLQAPYCHHYHVISLFMKFYQQTSHT